MHIGRKGIEFFLSAKFLNLFFELKFKIPKTIISELKLFRLLMNIALLFVSAKLHSLTKLWLKMWPWQSVQYGSTIVLKRCAVGEK